ncbi:hypothetical protein LCGC14_0942370 [marine sediment metagenome]|uniref:Uncharacterized protein n=1 Tax=marine sediment metagenome TaxID=412755 RepID=A0A0F9RR41_9ZZZZ
MKVIRVDSEVYAHLLKAKHILEDATQRYQSMSATVGFLQALHLEEGVDTLHGRHVLRYDEPWGCGNFP